MVQHFNPINQILIFPKIADRKLFFGLFCHPLPLFIIPPFLSSCPLSVIPPFFCHSERSVSGVKNLLRLLFCHSERQRRIPSFYETLRAKALRVTKKGHSASFLSFCPSYSVILRERQRPKNPLLSVILRER